MINYKEMTISILNIVVPVVNKDMKYMNVLIFAEEVIKIKYYNNLLKLVQLFLDSLSIEEKRKA